MGTGPHQTYLSIGLCGLGLGLSAFGLEQLDYRNAVRGLSTEGYVVIVALGFAALGGFVAYHLTSKTSSSGAFQRNDAAVKSLGLSARELEVLELLAAGRANKEIALDLGVSPNTVKTHLSNLYRKLETQRRTQAIGAARKLGLIP